LKRKKKFKLALQIGLLGLALYFIPRITLFYLACGLYDVTRNRNLNIGIVRQYFFGNGLFTWMLSPFNLLLDLLSLPNVNKGIYQLEDVPAQCRNEIKSVIETAYHENLIGKLEDRTQSQPRTMIFFKWYGYNVDTSISVPAYRRKFKYVKTIGVSVFRKRESTGRHFGPLRATLRVLYNINDMSDDSAFIRVGPEEHHWRRNKLFIFDDTLLHQSFNNSDETRYCLFVDIIRPTLFNRLLSLIVTGIRLCMASVNFVFYRDWAVIK